MRSKLSLFKLDFAKKILARERSRIPEAFDTRYKRPARTSLVVEHFYEKKAIDYPGQKTPGSKLLTKSLVDLYMEYVKTHPEAKVSLTTFKRRRPRNVCLVTSRKFLQCLCDKCKNAMLCMDVLNPFLKPKSVRSDLNERISNVEDLVNKTVCGSATRECWERECGGCGVAPLIDAIKAEIGDNLEVIKERKRWGKNENGNKDLLIAQCSVASVLAELEGDLGSLAKHLRVAHWQRQQYQDLHKCLPPRHAICTVDFAENYLCRYQNEVQSAHWSYRQVSVHPCVFFYACPECGTKVTEYLVMLSDDLKHDSHFTRSILDRCFEHVKGKGVAALHIFSDGCGAQYKSKTTFMDLTELQVKHNQIALTRHFFGSNHGKSLCDSCGGIVKNCATCAVGSGECIIQNANQMLAFCQGKLEVLNDNCLHAQSPRSFVVLDKGDILRKDEPLLKPVPGTRQIHSMKPTRMPGVLTSSLLSCFCHACLIGEKEPCPNEAFTKGWKPTEVRPASSKRQKEKRKTSKKSSGKMKKAAEPVEPPVDLNEAFIVLESDSFDVLPENTSEEVSGAHGCLDGPAPAISGPEVESRLSFFAALQSKMVACNTFSALLAVASSALAPMISYPLPLPSQKTMLQVGIIDKTALDLRPAGFDLLYPVVTVADGNCVPHTLSVFCFGDQDHHIEMRCRVAVELVVNQLDYLCLDQSKLKIICQLSDYASDNMNSTFQKETMSICKNAEFMGMWQLMAAANVLDAPLISVYPNLGPPVYQTAMNKKLMPRASCMNSPQAYTLMWSSTRSSEEMTDRYWVANHVVPMLPLCQPADISLA